MRVFPDDFRWSRTLSVAVPKDTRWKRIELGRWGRHQSGRSQRYYIAACVAVGGYYEDGGSAGAGYCSEYGRRPQPSHAHPHSHAHAHPHAPQPPPPHPAQHDQPMPCEYPHCGPRPTPRSHPPTSTCYVWQKSSSLIYLCIRKPMWLLSGIGNLQRKRFHFLKMNLQTVSRCSVSNVVMCIITLFTLCSQPFLMIVNVM